MGSKWKKVKIALGLNLCVYTPRTTDEEDEKSLPPSSSVSRFSDAAILSPEARWSSLPSTPTSNKLKLSKSLSKSSSKNTCSICLASMKRGDGQAIFTAECSHSFHFHCITSNVKHGNQICPVCRANWKEIPLQGPTLDPPMVKPRVNPVDLMTVVRRLPPRLNSNRHEPAVFNDDESLDHKLNTSVNTCQSETSVKIKTYTEFPEIQRSESHENFTILINLKAPGSNIDNTGQNLTRITRPPRAPVDLVTVLDISGSMAGTKLALLKRAMGFVIQNLGPNDRLSVISFSSTARRLFPLLRMSESGKQQAILAVNSLVANGGTNIAEGLRKGAKVMEDRREKNPVGSIILLSDGQDTYTVSNLNNSNNSSNVKKNYELLLPLSIREPVHAFGFGADHDALSMHSISEISGGTFSFIETESVIQDAFAQCIGGLLSVVVKGLKVKIESLVHLTELKTGNYKNKVNENGRSGFIDVGDMYADEERDFLISVNIPKEEKNDETSLLNVGIIYNDPFSDNMVNLEGEEVKIKRSKTGTGTLRVPVLEVDRQKNRFMAAKAMNDARALAENGSYVNAASVLETCRKLLLETISVKSKDPFCVGLDLELKEMQERMTSRHVYEVSGRAYILSGLSSHSWQRATARGDSTNGTSLVQAYQTPSMTEMVSTSHASSLHTPLLLRPNGRGV